MGMLGTLVDVEVVQQAASEGTLRQHALHGMAEDALCSEGLLAKLSGRIETLATGIARVAGVDLVGLFLTSEYHLLGIDNDYVVTAVNVRGESWLVLSADQLGYLRSKATHHLIGGIDHYPLPSLLFPCSRKESCNLKCSFLFKFTTKKQFYLIIVRT